MNTGWTQEQDRGENTHNRHFGRREETRGTREKTHRGRGKPNKPLLLKFSKNFNKPKEYIKVRTRAEINKLSSYQSPWQNEKGGKKHD